jgi:hypothetical protein
MRDSYCKGMTSREEEFPEYSLGSPLLAVAFALPRPPKGLENQRRCWRRNVRVFPCPFTFFC